MPKLAERLTDIKIKNTKPKEKPFRVAAGRGLFLLVKPDGSKYWVMRYQFEGKENNLSFGRYPEVSLANAEKQATEAHALLADSINPSEVRKLLKLLKRACLPIALRWLLESGLLVISPINQNLTKYVHLGD